MMSGQVRNWYGQVVKQLRDREGWTQEEVARRTGMDIPRHYIAKLENGQVMQPREPERRDALARVFGLTHAEMVAEARRLEAVARGSTVRMRGTRDRRTLVQRVDQLTPILTDRQLEHAVTHMEFLLNLDVEGG